MSEGILAINLHLETLKMDYERVTSATKGATSSGEKDAALYAIKEKMIEAENDRECLRLHHSD